MRRERKCHHLCFETSKTYVFLLKKGLYGGFGKKECEMMIIVYFFLICDIIGIYYGFFI
jgi:hypothetical protein